MSDLAKAIRHTIREGTSPYFEITGSIQAKILGTNSVIVSEGPFLICTTVAVPKFNLRPSEDVHIKTLGGRDLGSNGTVRAGVPNLVATVETTIVVALVGLNSGTVGGAAVKNVKAQI